jgi:hypothetical protein
MPVTTLAIALTDAGEYVSRDHPDASSVPYQIGDIVPEDVLTAFEANIAKAKKPAATKPEPATKPEAK